MYFIEDDLFDYLSDSSTYTVTSSIKETKSEGCFCRACKEFYRFAEPDNVIPDNKMTCWRCGTHIFRKYKGLPEDKVKEIDVIYKNK